MKKNILFFYLICSIFVSISCKNPPLTELSYTEYIDKISKGALPDAKDIKLLDEYGNQIDIDSFKSLHRMHDYYDTFFKDENGEIVQYMFKRKPEFRTIPIDCSRQDKILDSLYLIDQMIREQFNPKQDYKNLEIVTNVIKSCGMPDKRNSMYSMFMIVQHNHVIHMKEHIEAFRLAADHDLLSKSDLALMEDRILVFDGKPQLYGTQVKRKRLSEEWELCQLFEPENVDKRRATMQLGPLKDYLSDFDISFEVKQISNY